MVISILLLKLRRLKAVTKIVQRRVRQFRSRYYILMSIWDVAVLTLSC
ncbi:Uncharacterised protein [Vibrio cholerae]|nr:Uncharacterised protein [Vibrio cholerae]CSD36754.1 Uncharacterised protein [Vibrio cholerae]